MQRGLVSPTPLLFLYRYICACNLSHADVCTLQVRIITSNNCLSAGDALRDIDQRGVVRSDPFILVSGDVVSNIDLKSVIKQVRRYCSVAVSSCCGRSIAVYSSGLCGVLLAVDGT